MSQHDTRGEDIIRNVSIDTIKIVDRQRKDGGKLEELEALAHSIKENGLFQPIGITEDNTLVFGQRRLLVYRDFLDRKTIPARVVKVRSILDGQIDENCCRKNYTISELVAIVDALRSYSHGGDRRSDQDRNSDDEMLTVDQAAKRVGLGGKDNFYRARKVVESGTGDLVEAMDCGDIAVAPAAELAGFEKAEQEQLLAKKTNWKATEVAAEKRNQKLRQQKQSAAVLASTETAELHLSAGVTGDEAVFPCDLLIVDPPYGITEEPWEPADLEAFTKIWASEWSECKAHFIAVFFSQRHMWAGRNWLDEALAGYEFQQMAVWHAPNNLAPKNRNWLKQTWEPIFIYRRRDSEQLVHHHGSVWTGDLHDLDCHIASIPQTTYGNDQFKVHPCQKPVSVMSWLINALSKPSQKVGSLFCGVAPCGIAAVQLGRGYQGVERNEEYRQLAQQRLQTFGKCEQSPKLAVEILPNTVTQGDCIDLIPQLPVGSINLVVTSPPYAEQRNDHYPGVPERHYPEFTCRWMSALMEKLSDDGSVLIVIDPHVRKGVMADYVLRTQMTLRDLGWKQHRTLIWHKWDGLPLGHKTWPRHVYEQVLWFSKNTKPFCDALAAGTASSHLAVNGYEWSQWTNGDKHDESGIARLTDVLRVPVGANEKGTNHPAQFPVMLPEKLIQTFCPAGGMVLDPFCGSGSTLVAAKRLGRRFYGFDVVADYCETARRRVEHAELPKAG